MIARKSSGLLLFASILWFVSTVIWIGTFFVDLFYGYTSEGLMILHILCALISLLATVINPIRWKNSKHKGAG